MPAHRSGERAPLVHRALDEADKAARAALRADLAWLGKFTAAVLGIGWSFEALVAWWLSRS